MIPYGRQDISQEDIDAVTQVLRSDFLTQGPVVPRFEEAVAAACSVEHAVAVNSATSALHIACLALGVGPGDAVWTSPITFVASANCARYCGAEVDFVDIDPRSYNMSVEALKLKLQEAKKASRLPKVVIPVHLSGQSCDMEAIHALSVQYGFKIIEDASHAIGGKYKNKPVGSCLYSDITVLSFHPVKIITTAEGGMALTKNAALANHMKRLRSHGITREPSEMTHAPDGAWYYQQIELGLNYRLTELQAALGLSQLKRLNEFVAQRHAVASYYNEKLSRLPLTLPFQDGSNYSAYHLYVIRLHEARHHKAAFDQLRTEGVGVNLHYIPVYQQPYYAKMGYDAKDYPAAEAYYATAISIPMYSALSPKDQDKVIASITKVVG